MYNTGGLVFQNISGQDVRSRQNLHACEDLFLYEYARFLLHKRLVTEGLLSPYANPFYPLMDTANRETTNATEQTEKKQKEIDKNTIAGTLHKKAEDITLKEDLQNNTKEIDDKEKKLSNNTEWIHVKSKPNKAANRKTIQTKEDGEDAKDVNSYSALKENVEENQVVVEEAIDDDGASKKYDKDRIASPKERIYDVNNMDIEDMQAFLK